MPRCTVTNCAVDLDDQNISIILDIRVIGAIPHFEANLIIKKLLERVSSVLRDRVESPFGRHPWSRIIFDLRARTSILKVE
ncbi:hypothetical protein [Dyadobacter sp. MSC1_007]|uniref:hypothetical protein n=1 Tax=Dyadobacter sp. MSC1_007 TaxID=2909264 RepID=UPI002030F2DB|nr:hypothetical protein [Dyadobacter sp. MSC1_007]